MEILSKIWGWLAHPDNMKWFSYCLAAISALLAGAWWLKNLMSTTSSATLTPNDQSNNAQDNAKVGQQIGGAGHTVNQTTYHRDPDDVLQIERLTALIETLAARPAAESPIEPATKADIKLAVQTIANEMEHTGLLNEAAQAIDRLERGDVLGAEKILAEKEKDALKQATPLLLQAASLARQQAALFLGSNRNVNKAIECLERVLRYEPDDFYALAQLISLYSSAAALPKALNTAQLVLSHYLDLAKRDPSNSDWQRDLSVSFNKVAGVLEAQGLRDAALKHYQDSLKISEDLAKRDPSNVQWQTDLVVSFWKLANLPPNFVSKRQTKECLVKGLEILKTLEIKKLLSAQQQGWSETLQSRLDTLTVG